MRLKHHFLIVCVWIELVLVLGQTSYCWQHIMLDLNCIFLNVSALGNAVDEDVCVKNGCFDPCKLCQR